MNWISVRENFPDESDTYLVWMPNAGVRFRKYNIKTGWSGKNEVTHWMNIPWAPLSDFELKLLTTPVPDLFIAMKNKPKAPDELD